jgi:hypothetical protein
MHCRPAYSNEGRGRLIAALHAPFNYYSGSSHDYGVDLPEDGPMRLPPDFPWPALPGAL